MSEEEPESEDGLGKNIEHGVSDDLGVNIDVAGSISDTPDSMTCQCSVGLTNAFKLTLGRWSREPG